MIPLTLFFVGITLIFPGKVTFSFDILILFFWYLRFTLSSSAGGISVERIPESDYLFIGEPTKIRLRIENRSLFPIYFLKIEDLLREEGGLFKAGRGEFFVTLRPRGYKEFTYEVEFRKRGIYQVRDIKLTLFAPVSLFRVEKVLSAPYRIVVYPRRLPLESLPLSVKELLPLIRTNYRLLEDLSYIDGVREYTYMEPVKRIHWKASAHSNRLLVKKYEYTATTKVHLFIDINLSPEIFSKKVWSGIRKRYEEYVISAGASLVEYMISHRIPTRLYILGKGERPWIVEGMNFADLMENLAGIKGTDDPLYAIEDVFLSEMERFTPTSFVILFSMYLTPQVLPLLLKIKARVAQVIVIVAPFGFRDPESKRMERSYDIFPQDIRALEDATSLLREQGIKVELVEPEDALNEVLESI